MYFEDYSIDFFNVFEKGFVILLAVEIGKEFAGFREHLNKVVTSATSCSVFSNNGGYLLIFRFRFLQITVHAQFAFL